LLICCSLKTLSDQFKSRIPICAVSARIARIASQAASLTSSKHGTDELPDALFKDMIKRGVSKVSTGLSLVQSLPGCFPFLPRLTLSQSPTLLRGNCTDRVQINVNSWCRDPYAESLSKGLASKPFPDAQEEATEAMAVACERFFHLFGSAGKA
jgi:fructose-bisphosphate aldolase class II